MGGKRQQEDFLLSLHNLVIDLSICSPHYFLPTSPTLAKDTLISIPEKKKEEMFSGREHYQMKKLKKVEKTFKKCHDYLEKMHVYLAMDRQTLTFAQNPK